jgi:hypothetical protein
MQKKMKNKNSHKNPGRKIRFFKRNASHALCIAAIIMSSITGALVVVIIW